MDFEPVREELLVAVGARDLVWQAVLAELVFHNGVGGENHIGLAQLLDACLPLVAMIDHHLHSVSSKMRITKYKINESVDGHNTIYIVIDHQLHRILSET